MITLIDGVNYLGELNSKDRGRSGAWEQLIGADGLVFSTGYDGRRVIANNNYGKIRVLDARTMEEVK